jgi:ubiquinone/menaquinone biosynthesis C-methylase UbiE
VADGQALPFADATFDAVLCQLGLMFFPDPARGLAEFRRVLRPRRRAAVCVISITRTRADVGCPRGNTQPVSA